MSAGVYVIRCTANGRVYVGSARNVKQRRQRHLRDLRQGKHQNSHLQRAWQRYGPLAFTFEVVATPSVADLAHAEQLFIDAAFALGVQFNQHRRALMSSDEISARTKAALKPAMTDDERKARRRQRYRASKPMAEAERLRRIRLQPPMTCGARDCDVQWSALYVIECDRTLYCSDACRWREQARRQATRRAAYKRRRRQEDATDGKLRAIHGGVGVGSSGTLTRTGASDAPHSRGFEPPISKRRQA